MDRRHHHVVAAITVAVGLVVTPYAAFASSSPSAPTTDRALVSKAATSDSLIKAASARFKTFSSRTSVDVHHATPKSKSKPATVAASGNTIFVETTEAGCVAANSTGTGADPYCTIQAAVNAASPGDTVSVEPSDGYPYDGDVSISTSDLTLVGTGENAAWLNGNLTVSGAGDVSISGLTMYGALVVGSSHVTFDSDFVLDSMSIDGSSSAVTVSRTDLVNMDWGQDYAGLSIATGASNIVVASDLFSDYRLGGVVVGAVSSLDIVGNTIQRSCGAGISVTGPATGVSIENNLLEDPNTSAPLGGSPAACTQKGYLWWPSITVDAAAAAGTNSDYNDFYSSGSNDTAPYSWNGTTYPSLAAFQSATGVDPHDGLEGVEPAETNPDPFGWGDPVSALLLPGSAAIGTANISAPGELSSDYYKTSPYDDRGAIAYFNDNLVAAQTASDISALSVSDDASASTSTAGIDGYNFSWGDGSSTYYEPASMGAKATHTYGEPGTYQITLVVDDADGVTAATDTKVTTEGSDYTAFGPKRLLDTRSGIGAPAMPVPANGKVKLSVAGYGGANGIPADVTAVVLNLTVTNTHGSGFITAYDDGDLDGVPSVSNVNYVAGQTVPNLAIVPVGADGEVDLVNGGTLAGNVDLIADVTGYFSQSAASGYTSLTPDRLVDTRNGTGVPEGQVGQNDTIAVQIAGADGGLLPSTGITAVALNVTVTNPKGSGFLTAYPDGQSLPNASNVNYGQGQTIANSVIVPVASNGKIDIANSGALAKSTDIIVDVVGYYDPTSYSAYLPATPTRLVDTRDSSWTSGPLLNGPDEYFPLALAVDDNGNPESGVTALVLNATVTETAGNGFLTVAPDPYTYWDYFNHSAGQNTPPNSSNLNWTKGQTVPNLVQASTGYTGMIDVWNLGAQGAPTALILDGFGYYQNN